MSLVHIDSCGDRYSTAEIEDRFTISGVPTVVVAGGRSGSNGIRCSAAADWFEKPIPPLDEYFDGIAVKLSSITTTTDFMAFHEGAIRHVVVRMLPTGAIQILNGNGTILGATPASAVTAGFFAFVEVRAVIHDSIGIVVVRLDGIEVLNLVAQDTQNAGTGIIDAIRYQGSTDIAFFDDLYILNNLLTAPQNTFLGDTHIDANSPIGDGFTTNISGIFPAAPIDHFEKVDDLIPDGDATYVFSSVPNELDLFTFTSLPSIPGADTIFGVQLNIYARKDNEGGRQVKGLVRPTVANFDGAIGALPVAGYKYFFSLFDLDPQVAGAWTEATKNAAEFGLEIL